MTYDAIVQCITLKNTSLFNRVLLFSICTMPCYISTLTMTEESRKIRYRAVIEFLTLESKQPAEIFERLTRAYGDSAPSYATVKRWNLEFRRGRQSLEDDPRPGRPVEAVHDETIKAVERCVMANRRLSVSQIATTVGISTGSVEEILH